MATAPNNHTNNLQTGINILKQLIKKIPQKIFAHEIEIGNPFDMQMKKKCLPPLESHDFIRNNAENGFISLLIRKENVCMESHDLHRQFNDLHSTEF